MIPESNPASIFMTLLTTYFAFLTLVLIIIMIVWDMDSVSHGKICRELDSAIVCQTCLIRWRMALGQTEDSQKGG